MSFYQVLKEPPIENCAHYIQTGRINCIYSHSCPGGGPTEVWLPICTSKHHHHHPHVHSLTFMFGNVSHPRTQQQRHGSNPPIQWLLDCQTFQPDELFLYLSTHSYVWLSCCACLLRMRSNQIC